jgi:hypothetical protein
MKHFQIILILLISINSFPQKEKFEFDEGMCQYVGIFDSEKYTKVQLQNTLDYLYFSSYISTPTTAWKLEDIPKLNLDSLISECHQRINKLQSVEIVDSDFWKIVRQNRIREITETCQLKKITIIAYSQPDTLLSFRTSDSLTILFRDALINGGKKLIDAWIVLNEIQKAKNGFPENVQRKFDEEFKSPFKSEYARLAVIQFGWWNHANHLIYHNPQADYWSEYEKLFIKLDNECY